MNPISIPRSCRGQISLKLLGIGLLLLIGAGVFIYLGSDGYKSSKDFSHATELQHQGKYAEASALYVKWLSSKPAIAARAAQELKNQVIADTFPKLAANEMAEVIHAVQANHVNVGDALAPKRMYPIAMSAITASQSQNPYDAYQLLKKLQVILGDQPVPEDLSKLKLSLLELLVKQRPDDASLATDLAQIYEGQKKWKEIADLLLPHKARLGQGEGARILGQVLAAKGAVDDAYALLKPYTEVRLKTYRDAEKAYYDFINAEWDKVLAELRAGKAPITFWMPFKQADKATQQEMVNEYIKKHLDGLPEVKTRLAKLRSSAAIVPVALDLGIVIVGKAQASNNPDERKHYLQDAESTFLTIQGAVANTPDFQFYLGQVYYWLGKHTEGKQLFEKLLTSTGRSYPSLMTIATKLREVGDFSYARVLTEEAYKKGTTAQQRNGAARTRAVMQKDTDDAITWLLRADQTDPQVQVDLNNSRGNKAEENSQYTAALAYYRKAVDAYGRLPESASNVNNAALVYLSIARISKDMAAKQKGLELMDKAVSMDQSNSIALHNSASILMQAAIEDVLTGRINPEKLAVAASFDTLQFLYANQQQKDVLIKQLIANPAFIKAKAYYQKDLVLAPKSMGVHQDLFRIYAVTDSESELESLVESTIKVELDTKDLVESAQEYYSGKRNQEYRLRNDAQIQDLNKRLQKINKQSDKLTYALGLSRLVGLYIIQADLGVAINPDQVVNLARQAHELSPSTATTSALMSAFQFRVSHAMSKTDMTYKHMYEAMQRKLNPADLITAALLINQNWKDKIVHNPDFKKATELLITTNKGFKHGWRVNEWIMIQAVDGKLADEVAGNLRSDKVEMLSAKLTNNYASLTVSGQYGQLQRMYFENHDPAVLDKIRNLVLPKQ